MTRNSRMKKYQFLLLDAGPIIKLFELGLWDKFLDHCEVTVTQTVADEARFAHGLDEDVCIDLGKDSEKGHLEIVEVMPKVVTGFHHQFSSTYKGQIHEGELESLAFLCNQSHHWKICAADGAVFKVLGLLGKADQGISLDEILKSIGLSTDLPLHYKREFRIRHSRQGQIDSIQDE